MAVAHPTWFELCQIIYEQKKIHVDLGHNFKKSNTAQAEVWRETLLVNNKNGSTFNEISCIQENRASATYFLVSCIYVVVASWHMNVYDARAYSIARFMPHSETY